MFLRRFQVHPATSCSRACGRGDVSIRTASFSRACSSATGVAYDLKGDRCAKPWGSVSTLRERRSVNPEYLAAARVVS